MKTGRKIAGLFCCLIVFAAVLCGCEEKNDMAFQAEQIGTIEVYRYVGVPAAAEKKLTEDQNEIRNVCEQLLSIGSPKSGEALAGAEVISFRLHLDDGSACELIYTENTSQGLKEVRKIWDAVSSEAVSAEMEELPILER